MQAANPGAGTGGPDLRRAGLGRGVSPLRDCLTPLALSWGCLQGWGAQACSTATSPQNIIIGDSGSLSFPFCHEFSASMCWRCLCLGAGLGTQGRDVPSHRVGQVQTDMSADVCKWGKTRRGLHSICKWGEMDTLGEIFLLGLSRALHYSPSAQAFKELTCCGIREMTYNWVSERLKGTQYVFLVLLNSL